MIKAIRLLNFQGHRHTDIDFHEGVNVIAGQSDSGKSSIIRALRWVIENRPTGAGDAFRFHGVGEGEEVSVSVWTDDGHIVRYRNKSENGYLVDGSKLVAIKHSVPEEVSLLLNMAEHNLQTQHQPYFMVADSPGDVARKLNSVCGLNIIDECLKNASLLASRNANDTRSCEAKIRQITDELQNYQDLESREQKVSDLEQIRDQLKKVEEQEGTLSEYVESLSKVRKRITSLNEFLEIEDHVEPLLKLASKIQEVDKDIEDLENIIEQLQKLDSRIRKGTQYIQDKENEFHEKLKKAGKCPLCEGEIHE